MLLMQIVNCYCMNARIERAPNRLDGGFRCLQAIKQLPCICHAAAVTDEYASLLVVFECHACSVYMDSIFGLHKREFAVGLDSHILHLHISPLVEGQ